MSEWQPIETAPVKTNVLVWRGGVRLMSQDESGQWRNMMGRPRSKPTHWMPLPPSPHTEKEG